MPDRSLLPYGPVAYLTGVYPKVSHTFILREVAALRALGADVLPCSVRRPPPEEVRGLEAEAEFARTFLLLEAARSPLRLAGAHLRLIANDSRRWGAAARLAWRTRPAGLKATLWQAFYFAEAGVLARHLQARGAVHLHNHLGDASGTVAMIAATMAGIPFSYTAHGPDLFFAPIHWRIDEKTARARFVACISHFCRSQLMIFSDPAHWHKLAIVRCGVEPARYGDAPRARFDQRVLFIGRLAAVKGVPLLLEAFARVAAVYPNARLTLVGDGPERAMLESLAMTLGLTETVHFAGYRSQEEVKALLNEADMLVLPSFAEGLPVVLMEALASRIPVIATQVAGVSELVRDGETGLLVPPGDVNGLVEALDRLLADPSLCRRLGEAGRAAVLDRHDVTREAERLLALFRGGAAEKPVVSQLGRITSLQSLW
ncbi:glycosyltransferase family 4 protein [Pararhodobacter sp. SW119]|uniref:glycosyltransferase family 4 protein n=1 Tax=Pararhodobacter sp. SW119 TaxID=2780075 RepID=UPI001ADEEA04|nr:glycosyltransferase family 4 protein [Pararhodobacter sp. SW119]